MKKRLICIECPAGCTLSVDVENGRVVKLEGNKCEKGETYAIAEIENPTRVLTTTVLAEGLQMKMIPVRTDRPIPKERMFEAMDQVRKVVVRSSGNVGDVVARNILGMGANLIATRKFS
jgi:CxxC motif-containing protein